ncbi:ABC transporter ATP-binding protein [Thermosulfurimonas sp. F29]|uniref:ABC transporter ATP-binding protein n=1 Tax=Thermosulfurimonas sp. F29 TaxID=2867247 RepID=UPI001C82F742|nr:ABC transporter ATP-binding protein [Thermosulfurimonas sp. F29]MBX6422278.1 ABC transporter ATP-binding protein/permease [Thermosulfurimonas sp. F29]
MTSPFAFLTRVLRFLKPYWSYVALALLFSLLASLTSGGIAWLVKPVMDEVFIAKNYLYLRLLPLGVIAFFGVRGVASLLQAYFMRAASLRMVNDLRVELYRKLIHLPLAHFERDGSGRNLSRVLNDTLVIEPILSNVFQVFLLEGFNALVLLAVAFSRSLKLTLVSLLVLPAIAYGGQYLSRKVRRHRRRAQRTIGELTHRLTETFTGLREVKVYGRESGVLKLFRREIDRYAGFLLKITKYREGSKSLVDVMTGVGGAMIIALGGYLIVRGELSPGAFFSVLTAILMLFTPIRKMARAYTGLSDAQAAWERLEEVLRLPEERGGTHRARPLREGIRFEGVSFRYPGAAEWALKDLDLEIPVGRVTALVGPSGAGKSTLAALIPRFYDPTEGRILWDGMDLREFDLESLRGHIGLVSQEIVIFNATVAENIAFGDPGASRTAIEEAARLANAHEFIEKLPQGYDTLLGEGGVSLSGGQKQRLAIARAILRNPSLLILDEATSQLDPLSERLVQEALSRLMRGRTTLVIAHRISTITGADKIVVLERGRKVAEGRHQELLATSPLYRKLYRLFQG